jgi:hypothetical protein
MLVVEALDLSRICPGLICQTLCGVPGFSFSRTMTLGFAGAAVAVGDAVAAGVKAFVLAAKGSATLGEMVGPPGVVSLKLRCALCGTAPAFGFNRSPAVCAGVRL